MRTYALAALAALALPALAAAGSGHEAHDLAAMGALNAALGTHGFPDCVATGPVSGDLEKDQLSMKCFQRGSATALKIGCVGDSITAGAHSSGPTKTYPAQLQALLDPAAYAVTNLGACGSTMQKGGDSPYWQRPQYQTLIGNKWDIIVIMLGTNDAKDPGDGGPNNWHDNCGSSLSNLTLTNCSFAIDSLAMIEVVRSLGPVAGVPPLIYLAMPPPLMEHGSIGANATVINSVYPALVPIIAQKAGLPTVPISIYSGMGGTPSWQEVFPPSCVLTNSPWPACKWFCDAQSCDQCHPNDNGYSRLAQQMKAGLGL